ncbi:MAG TPA: T9SS type A sorting domain-containing protein, partial [bacterium]|nr:T9SS type A sorting domain-containing protein [bacterium]
PNPVTGTATFTITPPQPTRVKLEIFDLAGRKVDTVFDDYVTTAGATAAWTANVTPGLYLYALETESGKHIGKVVVSR